MFVTAYIQTKRMFLKSLLISAYSTSRSDSHAVVAIISTPSRCSVVQLWLSQWIQPGSSSESDSWILAINNASYDL